MLHGVAHQLVGDVERSVRCAIVDGPLPQRLDDELARSAQTSGTRLDRMRQGHADVHERLRLLLSRHVS